MPSIARHRGRGRPQTKGLGQALKHAKEQHGEDPAPEADEADEEPELRVSHFNPL